MLILGQPSWSFPCAWLLVPPCCLLLICLITIHRPSRTSITASVSEVEFMLATASTSFVHWRSTTFISQIFSTTYTQNKAKYSMWWCHCRYPLNVAKNIDRGKDGPFCDYVCRFAMTTGERHLHCDRSYYQQALLLPHRNWRWRGSPLPSSSIFCEVNHQFLALKNCHIWHCSIPCVRNSFEQLSPCLFCGVYDWTAWISQWDQYLPTMCKLQIW